MAEAQTIDEMRAAFDGEWVIIVDCRYDDASMLRGGRVFAHSRDKAEIYEKLPANTSGAIRYFGEVPADLYYML